ncbi:12633_t:CDS:2 [Dentiscutata erythropus]|uniref:12633_t:CDS:1 n=1 Tax=Dentiscutata erythropus TaxID=1348616 RepID=A0A9N9IRV6_9GLOM|nr:12633_t:CDS:2 [Dentiscutata erythropus]
MNNKQNSSFNSPTNFETNKIINREQWNNWSNYENVKNLSFNGFSYMETNEIINKDDSNIRAPHQF